MRATKRPMVKIELWCVQEDLHLADIEIQQGGVLSENAIKKGIKFTSVSSRKHLLREGRLQVEDSKTMLCQHCSNALRFFAGGFDEIKVIKTVAEVLPTSTVKDAWKFDHPEPEGGSDWLGRWIRVRPQDPEQGVNVVSSMPVGVVIREDEEHVTIRVRTSFVAMPGLGRVQ